jgi:ABC-type lipoprotein release transport system permease subunit
MKLLFAVAWRNLWRNPRRTGLSAGGIAFAILLLVFSMSLQSGSYSTMIDTATGLLSGHIQVQARGYLDNPRLRDTVENAAAVRGKVEAVAGVTGTAMRSSAFALVALEERAFAAQIVGVEPAREREITTLPERVRDGRYLGGGSAREAVIGSGLARNIGAALGSEIVILGTAMQGGVAAMVLEVVGIIESGMPELDRVLVQVRLSDFGEAFGLTDAVSMIVVRTEDVSRSRDVAVNIADVLDDDRLTVVPWNELVPELEQAIELDRVFGYFFYVLLAAMVVFSIVNTFIMTVFERTREFGTLMSIGGRPGFIVALLQLESLLLAILGTGVGLLLGAALTLYFAEVGIYLGEAGAEIMRQFHMPERLHPSLNFTGVWLAPLLMLAATQFAALVPALRVRRLDPVEARRME